MLVLPEFRLLKKQPKVPHVAHVVVSRDVPNEYGTPITYVVQRGRSGKNWWIRASHGGMRASDTLHTTNAAKADEWIRAVDTGQIRVGEQKTEAQLDREIAEALARLKEKQRRKGAHARVKKKTSSTPKRLTCENCDGGLVLEDPSYGLVCPACEVRVAGPFESGHDIPDYNPAKRGPGGAVLPPRRRRHATKGAR